MNTLKAYFNKSITRHLLFWIAIFAYSVLAISNMDFYYGYKHVFETYAVRIGLQIITAYTCIYFLIPQFLNKRKTILFTFFLVILLIVMFALYYVFKVYYFELKYFEYFTEAAKEYAKTPYLDRILNFPVFLSKCILFLTPTALLLMSRFYKNQQNFLKLNEQKKIAELTALKHQLNPHFLFNTLNNLYALALEKSDTTPEVIERLSDILDYMLYRCNDNFVSLQKEATLINNYLALEKIRYGKRVAITFDNRIIEEVKIAPLILLAFIENAFKHAVRQELKVAKINISLSQQNCDIVFSIYNTKPEVYVENGHQKTEGLGLENVKKQLELLYTDHYDLQLDDSLHSYAVTLRLKQY